MDQEIKKEWAEEIKQCCSCEEVFNKFGLNKTCPNCLSGNWVKGYIDEMKGGID